MTLPRGSLDKAATKQRRDAARERRAAREREISEKALDRKSEDDREFPRGGRTLARGGVAARPGTRIS